MVMPVRETEVDGKHPSACLGIPIDPDLKLQNNLVTLLTS